jgi:branched-chain amino acid transport system permease protein
LWGPVIGAFILESGQQYLAYRLGGSQVYLIAYAMVFLIIMLVLPRGVLPTIQERLRGRRRRRLVDAVPPSAGIAARSTGVGVSGGGAG